MRTQEHLPSPRRTAVLSVCICVHLWLIAICVYLWLGAAAAIAQTKASDPVAPLAAEVAAAEQALRNDERQIAESHYRAALYHGWMVTAAIAVSERRLADAREAFGRAAGAVVDNHDALQSLAIVDLQLNDATSALVLLTRLVAVNPKQPALRRLLAQALVANRQPEEAVQTLEEAHAAAPADLETTFALASGYLQVKKVDAAGRLFDVVAAARPIPQTYVLIGRAYRDADQYDRARGALEKALAMDPRVRHAHYYLGTLAVRAEGILRVDEAIKEFGRELDLAADDPFMHERLGIALVEARREAEALPHLQIATRAPAAGADAWQYLGRAQLAAQQPHDAVASLRRALALTTPAAGDAEVGNLHYQLARALRQAGDAKAADAEFAQAERSSVARTENARNRLARFMRDADEGRGPDAGVMPSITLDAGGFSTLTATARRDLTAQLSSTLARVYLNLGVMHARADRFGRAAELFEQAAAIDPAFPQVQYSLGVAWFNAQQYTKAAAALARAAAADPGNADVRRMLALASLQSDDFARAADLLRDDPQRESDPSLQFAYGIALVRSGRAADAESTFSRLVAAHAGSPELNVVLGEAHAEQGDFDAAVKSLERALALKPDVAEANAALGLIYLKQGRLADSVNALRTELSAHPEDVKARHTLATVLDLDGRSDEALREVRTVLKARPQFADARYLHGKILLARGAAAEAAEQLEIAARLAPDDANVHYQLGQAYQKLGRTELAQQQFDVFQKLKDKRRGGSK